MIRIRKDPRSRLGWTVAKTDDKNSLNPIFLSGFIDAEGSFMIRIRKDPRSRLGWSVAPLFQISIKTDRKFLWRRSDL